MAEVVTVTGLEELYAKFRTLGTRVENKVVRQALRKGAKALLPAVQAEAPVASGKLKQSLRLKVPRNKKRGQIAITVEPNPENFRDKHGYYPAVVEYGRTRMKRARGASHKKIKNPKYIVQPNPYLKRAFDKNKSALSAQLRTDIRDGILLEAAKHA